VNPASGTTRKRFIEQEIRKQLQGSALDYEIVFTQYAGHATVLAREAVEKGFNAVIAVGGDGSVNEVAKALVGTKTALGIIPVGSGNGFARHLKIPLNVKKAIQTIRNFNIAGVDTGYINDSLFISISGVGFDAHVAHLFAQGKRRGFVGYLMIVIREFFRYSPNRYLLEIDGKIYKRKAFSVVFANSDQFGYNTSIAPTASIHDGLLDICIIGKPSFFKIPVMAGSLLTRQINRLQEVEIIKGKKIVLRRKLNLPVNVDGEALIMSETLHIRVNPMSMRVIIS
jgi:YegS/Rv2252/BmrU family lipid kinase